MLSPQMVDTILASYNATKAALVHWGSTARVELAPLGFVNSHPRTHLL